MVFNATFNNISVLSWSSVLLMEETGENHRPVTSRSQTLSHNVVSSAHRHEPIQPLSPLGFSVQLMQFGWVKPMTITLVFVTTPLSNSIKEKERRLLARNQNNVVEWSGMSIRGLLHNRNSTKCVGLVQSGSHHHLIENQLFSP